jgi:asparagine synthase (glutamine-hydrolysing)
MCGICGKINFRQAEPVSPELLRAMMARMQHRGPDAGGEYLADGIGLGHRRLSIIDLSADGNQPMCNEDGTIWIVFNGEIYNFQSLREDLIARGHTFKSRSDTEVIIHLYEEHGPECVKKLQGMFAFAIWDKRHRQLFLARDRVGIKPLYYTQTANALLFASELKSLLVDESVPRHINPRAIDSFLTYYYLPGEETLLQGVFKLLPGHSLLAREGRIQIREYWDLHYSEPAGPSNFADAVAELRALLRRTVREHMISDVPVGVLLSGGVDSTGVLRYAVEETGKRIKTFTIGFDGEPFADERHYANIAAKRYGTDHADLSFTAKDFQEFLPGYVWHMEDPICEPPAIALYYISKLARQSVTVVLSGEGGDEAFGGYQNYRNLLAFERLQRVFGSAKGLLRAGLNVTAKTISKRFNRYADLVGLQPEEYYFSRTASPFTWFNKHRNELYHPDFAKTLNGHAPFEASRQLWRKMNGAALLNKMLYVDTKTWLPDDLLTKADKMTMANSLELRVPLLDHKVLEFAAALPASFKVKGFSLKRLLKAALRDSVPEEILTRKKTGFPVPYERWLRADLKNFAEDILLRNASSVSSCLAPASIKKLLVENQRLHNFSKEIFCLLVLELWHDTFLKPHRSQF